MRSVACITAILLASAGSAAAAPGPNEPVAQPFAGTVVEPEIDCHPTERRPNPVVVLPGGDGSTGDTAADWATVVTALRAAGYCTLIFQGGVVNEKRWAGDIPTGARQTADFIARVRERTGAERVDLVAHSVGTVVANYFLKVLRGAPQVAHAVLLAPEARDCDGAGLLAPLGIENPPITPGRALREMPFLAAGLTELSPELALAVQLTPQSPVYHAIFDGPIAQPGVRYSVLASRHDEFATPPETCSIIIEPGVTMDFYEDRFPGAAPVGHSALRSSVHTAGWVLEQLAR
ncbi:lipase family alpha/beta hydrolase [Nocardia sp. NPDC056000]|uniref:lipase family alpha/beta hydrolase n=1 Tax=Nocardia sp. NPDC056000 TaxID=3345674 RepID=UPI0035DD99C7